MVFFSGFACRPFCEVTRILKEVFYLRVDEKMHEHVNGERSPICVSIPGFLQELYRDYDTHVSNTV